MPLPSILNARNTGSSDARACDERTSLRANRHRGFACIAIGLVSFALEATASAQPGNGEPSVQQQNTSINHAPEWVNAYDDHEVRVGTHMDLVLSATDADKDRLTFTAAGLPAGARFSANGLEPNSARLRWTPTANDIGVHEIELSVSDGRDVNTRVLRVIVEDQWESYLLPGVQYSALFPAARGTWGDFQGISGELLIASWIHRNENRGPSHGRVYLDLDVLRSNHEDVGAALDVTFGFDLSIERNPYRHFLLPYFGLKTGAFTQKSLDGGAIWEATPLLGMYLYADRNVFVTASAGYFIPFSAQYFDALRGTRVTAGVNLSLW